MPRRSTPAVTWRPAVEAESRTDADGEWLILEHGDWTVRSLTPLGPIVGQGDPRLERPTQKENGMSESVIQVVDPVCGMTIDREKAVVIMYQGTTYYFCEDVCAEIFQDEPERWVEKFVHDPTPHAH